MMTKDILLTILNNVWDVHFQDCIDEYDRQLAHEFDDAINFILHHLEWDVTVKMKEVQ